MTSESVQESIDRIRTGELPMSNLIKYLSHRSPLVRVNAMEVLALRGEDSEASDALREAAADPRNRTRLFGTVTAADVAIACLMRIGTDSAVKAAAGLVSRHQEPHRSDLLWYLRSEGLIPEAAAFPSHS